MKIKGVCLASIVFALLFAYSCRMPDSIEIRVDGVDISVPLRAEINIATMLENVMPEAFNARLYDFVNHERGAQAFLVAFELDMLPSLNLSDYLDSITGQLDDYGNTGIEPIEADIKVPRIAWDPMEPTTFYFDMGELFETMENSLNTYSMPVTTTRIAVPSLVSGNTITISPLPPEMQNMPSFFVFAESGEANFDSVIVSDVNGYDNKILLGLELINASPSLPLGLEIILTGIRMVGENTRNIIGLPDSPQNAILNHLNGFSQTITIDISGEEIRRDDPPRFEFTGIEIEYNGPSVPGLSFDLRIRPQVSGIALRGATGLRIGEMTHPLPDSIANNIRMNATPGFLNAEIGIGELNMTAAPPPRRGGNETYGEGLQITNTIAISQAPIVLDGETFEGLNDNEPWVFGSENTMDLGGKIINGSPMVVNQGKSSLFITSDPNRGISFELFGNDYIHKRLPIIIGMDMNIYELTLARWEMSDDLIPIPEIMVDFTNMGDGTNVAEFVESITFEKIEFVLNLTELDQALDGRFAFAARSPKLGFFDHIEPEILERGDNNLVRSEPATLNVREDPNVEMEVAIVPVIDGTIREDARHIAFGPLVLDPVGETKLAMVAEISIDFVWEKAVVDLVYILGEYMGDNTALLSGGVPEEPIDLRGTLGDIMRGFTFADGSIDLTMYLDGPAELISQMEPKLSLHARSREVSDDPDSERSVLLFEQVITADDLAEFPDLSNFEGTQLPKGGFDIDIDKEFFDIIADMPEYLRLFYDIKLPATLVITPGMFDDHPGDDGSIRGVVIAKVAMEFEAKKGAYINIPLFENQNDLFGRTSLDGSLLGGNIDINIIRFRLDFDAPIFLGMVLHVDGGGLDIPDEMILFGRDGRVLDDGRGNLEIAITGSDLNIVRDRLIPPDIRIAHPGGAEVIRIPRNPLPTRITVSLSGGYALAFGD